MKLKIKKYTNFDIFLMSLKASPFCVSAKFILVLAQSVVPTLLIAVVTAYFVDTALAILVEEYPRNAIYLPFGFLLLVIFFANILSNISSLVGSKMAINFQQTFVPEVLRMRASLEYKHIEDEESQELAERIADKIADTFLSGINSYGTIISGIVAILSLMALILNYVWWASLIIVALCVPLFFVAIYAGKKNYEAEVDFYEYERRYSYYTDVLTNREGVEERTLFGYTDDVNRRYSEQHDFARKHQFRISLKMYLTSKSVSVAMVFVVMAVAIPLITPAFNGELSPGMYMGIIAAVLSLVNILGWSLQDAAEQLSALSKFKDDLINFMELSNTDGATDLPDKHPASFNQIEFRNVKFKYPTGKKNVLNGISFVLENGKSYSIVGENGSGKSTIIKLLTGLYREYEGEILVDNIELRDYPQRTIKSLFSVVFQDYAKYQISMADNIALGDISCNTAPQTVKNAVNAVGLENTIGVLKNGLNTKLGRLTEKSIEISGGQWQRVALARSLVSRAPVKILDEPTAALDPIAESNIYKNFETLMEDKTTVLISHRLGSTKLADEILVINNGAVAEKGSHVELMAIKGEYSKMYNVQKEWYK